MSVDGGAAARADAARVGPYTHLMLLAVTLRDRGWRATVTGLEHVALLTVTNPGAPALTEGVVCRKLPYGWHFCWSWEQPIGPVTEVETVADRIAYVLRTAGE